MSNMAEIALETRGLTKRFGGLCALDGVDLKIEEGEIRGLIGPNGAGKSTLVNLIIGKLKPTTGKILIYGEDVTGLPPHAIISEKRVGVAFQHVSIFPKMTVLENVWLSLHARSKRRWNPFIRAESLTNVKRKAEEICDLVGLGDKMGEVAANLSYGDQKLLEFAIALGNDPLLLLLDEPIAGVSPGETEKIAKVIKEISKGRTIVLIEHNIDFVLKLADRITVLDKGKVIAEGTPQEIRTNERVQRVYLGVE